MPPKLVGFHQLRFLEMGIFSLVMNVILEIFLNQGVKDKILAENRVKTFIFGTDIASVVQICTMMYHLSSHVPRIGYIFHQFLS